MNQRNLTHDLINYTLRLADDALILGHRLSEWASCGPFLEEDIAMANVALDYIGRARMLYGYAAELTGEGKTEDDFAYLRSEREFKNCLINELPRGDFAHTIVRQLLIDEFNLHYLNALKSSKDVTLAAIAEKGIKETHYHLRRSKKWTLRLGDGTEESQQRMQTALDDIWGFTHELFESDALDRRLIVQGIAVDSSQFKQHWFDEVSATIEAATLQFPDQEWAVRGGREGYHTEYLGRLLAELQSVHRTYPGCQW